jgi:hypothetical protein
MSVGDLVKIWTDVGGRKPIALLAKIVDKDLPIFVIKYLSESKDDGIWRYEEDVYEVDSYSIAEYLKTKNEIEVGFQEVSGGYIKIIQEDEEDDEDEENDQEDEEENDEEDVENDDENEESSVDDSEDSLEYD